MYPGKVAIFDLPKLYAMAEKTPQLVQELSDLIRKSRMEGIAPLDDNNDLFGDLPAFSRPSVKSTHDELDRIFGDLADQAETGREEVRELIRRLKEVRPGRDDAAEYERLCEMAIKELFSDDLGEFSRQHAAADGFHRFDLIASIKPQSDFWVFLRTDFRSRYIVFEIKNYTHRITQDQVYSTEKYLFTNALRSIAIIIAHNGEDEGAKHARYGALRETGKLILTISQADLLRMLEMKVAGDPYIEILAENLDNMLRSLGR